MLQKKTGLKRIYRYYNWEKENPFDHDNQNKEHMFWFYESIFEKEFTENDSAEWHSLFDEHDMSDKFMKILSDEDYERPTEAKKKLIFELWLEYLFAFKLYPEYGGENKLKADYYSESSQNQAF